MTKQELIDGLRALSDGGDFERAHSEADKLLCQYIGDAEVTEAFLTVAVWCA